MRGEEFQKYMAAISKNLGLLNEKHYELRQQAKNAAANIEARKLARAQSGSSGSQESYSATSSRS